MLYLLFYVGDKRYACEYLSISQVLPRVKLEIIPHSPHYISGLLNFGGNLVPIIDFSQLIENRPSSDSLHTRIILIQKAISTTEQRVIGILSEKVTDILSIGSEAVIQSGIQSLNFLKGSIADSEGIIQLVNVEKLFELVPQGKS